MSRILLLTLLHAISTISFAQTPATNDECAVAIPITVSPTSACSNSVHGVTYFASQSLAPCTGTTANDVWFQFTATDATQIIQLTNLSLTDPVLEVFSGACGSLTSIACHTAGPVNTRERRRITGLTIGNSYYIRVYANSPNYGEFRLCIFPPGPNDECAAAVEVPLNTGLNWTTYTTGNNYNNSPSGIGCTAANQADGWFWFTALDTAHLIYLTGPVTQDFYNHTFVQVFAGSCGSLTPVPGVSYSGVSSNCYFPGPTNGYYSLRGLTPGNIYYINVFQNIINPANTNNTFNIAISNLRPNDFIDGAEEITVNPGTECTSMVTGNFRNSTPGYIPNPGCGASNYETDIWFKFTASSTRHLIYLKVLSANVDPDYQVYYMDNGNLQFVACPAGSPDYMFNDLNSLTPGGVYYIRLNGDQVYLQDELVEFCITTPAAIPAGDDCSAAETIPINQQLLSSTEGSTATIGNTSRCVGTGAAPRDNWYTFTPSSNVSAILRLVIPNASPYTGGITGIELYTGACGAQTRINCLTTNATDRVYELAFSATAGTTYYARFYKNGTGGTPFSLAFSLFAPLPVTITDFKATHTPQGTVKLIWNTEEESQINYYEIERSINGIEFNPIARIPARNFAIPSEYTAEDLSPVAGVTYYRLKIVDQDGTIEYSKTVTMNIQPGFTGNLKVGRQGNFIMINNQGTAIKNVTLNIYTATGQRIYSAPKRLAQGANAIAVPGKTNQPLFIQVITETKEVRTFKIF